NGMSCGVMHAGGHDAHNAILMGVAELLPGMRERVPGSGKVPFQPPQGGPAGGEGRGRRMRMQEGWMGAPEVGAVFGLHVTSNHHTGKIGSRSGPLMASSDELKVFLRGEQTHAAQPWRGIDPIVVGSQVVLGLQTIVSRRMDITHEPSVV